MYVDITGSDAQAVGVVLSGKFKEVYSAYHGCAVSPNGVLLFLVVR